MRRLRDSLTFLVLVVLVGISVAAGVQSVRTGLPVPIEDRRDELRQMLTEGRVRDLPELHQKQLLRQLEHELSEGVDWRAELTEIPPRRRNLATDNVASLAALWLHEKVDEYYSLPNEYEQEQFLDQEIQRLMRWKAVRSLQSGALDDADPRERDMARDVGQRVMSEVMLRHPQDPMRAMAVWNAVQERWKANSLRNMVPTGPPSSGAIAQ
jgi:hypothetical protein